MLNSFYEITVTLIYKAHKDSAKKEYKSSLVNTDAKTIKYFHIKSKSVSKRSFTMIKQASFQSCRDVST